MASDDRRNRETQARMPRKYQDKIPYYPVNGIAVGEIVMAGCIVGVPDGGRQTENVNYEGLTFVRSNNVAGKIVKVLQDSNLQSTLQRHLREQPRGFSLNSFLKGIQAVAAQFLEENGKPAF